MEIKSIVVPFEMKEHEEKDDDFFYFKGHGAVFGNIDFGGDRIIKGAFSNFLKHLNSNKKSLPVLWQHFTDMPVGVYVNIEEDEKGLFVEGKLPKNDTFVSGRIIPQMKVGSIRELSIGYAIVKSKHVGDIRELQELTLREISLVTMAMNEDATISEMKRLLTIGDFKNFDERTIERAFKTGIAVSGKNAKLLISLLKTKGMFRDETAQHRDGEVLNEIITELKSLTQSLKGEK